ncbi:MAG TPA: sigma-70 family RNA polymerase sigma factor [Acidimicrobiales bacterium]|jgi:RNA polymerase sigma-70 factor (ECF subfamily)
MERPRRSASNEVLDRFEDFFRENYSRLFQYVARRVPSAQVDDLVAASFIVAWRKFERTVHPTLPWLFRIASYEISNHRRSSRKWNNVVSFEVVGDLSSPSADSDVDAAEMDAVLSRLSLADQEILRLIHWDALTRTEVAEVLLLTLNATNVRYHRALRRLHDQMPPPLRGGTDGTHRNLNSPPVKGALP